MSHKKKILGMSRQILLPVVLALCLLPPLACLIFRASAQHYAYKTAEQELEALQERVMLLVKENFSATEQEVSGEDARRFLRNTSAAVREVQGQADVLAFAEGDKRIYPRKEIENDTVLALSEACFPYLKEFEKKNEEKMAATIRIQGGQAETYLIQIYQVPGNTPWIRRLVTYSPVDYINRWIGRTTWIVLIISLVLASAVLVVLNIAVQRVEKGTLWLCKEAQRIGGGNFEPISDAFSVEELENLRKTMNQMAEKLRGSQEARTRFLQDISHDLRTPLMSIGGYAQGIEQGVLTDTASAASVILEESERLTERVNQLLQLSRLEQPVQTEAFVKVNVAGAVASCRRRMEGLAEKRGVCIEQTGVRSGPVILATEKLMEQVLDNLCSNAIRYAKKKVELEVQIRGPELSVVVRDDGVGIAEEDLPHVFERAYAGRGGQSGLGLAIAQAAAAQMHGSLHAGNAENGGAEFVLMFDGVGKG